MKDLEKIITEDFVSFELSKLLKEKGFDEECHAFYVKSTECGIELFLSDKSRNYNDDVCPRTSAPTLQMVRKWLKIVHNIGIFPSTYAFSNADGSKEYHPYGCAIIDLKTHELLTNDIFSKETEEATVEEAIKFCLKLLNNN